MTTNESRPEREERAGIAINDSSHSVSVEPQSWGKAERQLLYAHGVEVWDVEAICDRYWPGQPMPSVSSVIEQIRADYEGEPPNTEQEWHEILKEAYEEPEDIGKERERERTRLRVVRQAQELFLIERGEHPLQQTDDTDDELPILQTLGMRLAAAPEQLEWTIDELLPAGSRALVSGEAKAGKTTLRDNLLRSLADGVPFLDRFDVHSDGRPIVVLDVEMPPNLLDDYLRQQGIEHPNRVLPMSLYRRARMLDFRQPRVRDRIVEHFQAATGPAGARGAAVIVVDAISTVFSALDIDEDSPQVGPWLAGLDELCAKLRASWVLFHHMGHEGKRARGSSMLLGWPDVLWNYTRNGRRPDSPRYLAAEGRAVGLPPLRVAHDPATNRVAYAGTAQHDESGDPAADAVLAYVRAEPGATVRAIQEALKGRVGKDAVTAQLGALADAELLRVEPGERGARLHFPIDDDGPTA